MKHSVKMLLCLVLCVCTLACFAACKKDETAPAAANTIPTDTATIYYLSGVKYGTEKVWTLEQLDIADPEMCYIYFATDGTGELHIDLYDSYFLYENGQLWDELTPDTKVNYTINGTALTLEQDGYALVFTQGELPDWALPQEDDMIEDAVPEDYEETPAEEDVAEATAG